MIEGNMATGASVTDPAIPQWKRDLIRRRQQSRGLSPGGGPPGVTGVPDPVIPEGPDSSGENASSDAPNSSESSSAQVTPALVQNPTASGAASRELNDCSPAGNVKSVACSMHLESNGSLCREEPPTLKTHPSNFDNCELTRYKKYGSTDDSRESPKNKKNLHNEFGNRERIVIMDDCESDSSEELQYGPGIVNKLKSKYLNLTLRETNKTRGSVQRFRRAASLEDLLDCDHETEKTRKFTKKAQGVSAKPERYRNSSRGNDSMKRARSVETLMRYQSEEDKTPPGKLNFQKEPVNDHIVLIDRTTVNIENRLMKDRPKAMNKPKRVRPLLADTERPPPDLVKTTLRIFEGSVKKLKPKGEVAVKVATFKTINDTLKAQTIKKIVPKPPLQPKPFVNGGLKGSSFPKKTPDLETPEVPRNGVASDPIVQSVSSVVSKFQMIEKSASPASASPEPSHKFKFSPAPSPEPFPARVKGSEGCAKAVPVVLGSLGSKRDSRSNACQGSMVTSCDTTCQTSSPEKPEGSESGRDISALIEEKALQDSREVCENEEVEGTKEPARVEEPRAVSVEVTFEGEPLGKAQGPSNGVADSLEGKAAADSTDSKETSRVEEAEVELTKEAKAEIAVANEKPIGAISSLGLIKTSPIPSYPSTKESKMIKSHKSGGSPIPKQIGIIRPLVSMKTQVPQQNLSNRELEKNLINRVKNIEQPTKVVVSLKTAEEIQPVNKSCSGGAGGEGGGGSGGLWDTKPWNQQNNTMVFNFSNRKDVPDYIENDGLIIRRKRDKPKVGDGGIIVLDATLDASTTDEGDWEMSRGPPSPCDVLFTNDNVLINGRSNLIRTPRNHKHRIQFDDDATRTFEYPSEASMLEDDASGETSATGHGDDHQSAVSNKSTCSSSTTGNSASPILGGGGLASYTPSKVDLTSDGFELGITRSVHPTTCGSGQQWETRESTTDGKIEGQEHLGESHDAAWGVEATADLLY
ncbi:uncharacterized protein LOC107038841 [Diachasma alloeum]|uniref:uncharacterized protein LOC107038841 n=1 Tax=Diachasma alloeum TaxID=454923 RepID=UPI00073813E6|nr:uncharacterized protein LOC107038841 [Diachasma alloeum]